MDAGGEHRRVAREIAEALRAVDPGVPGLAGGAAGLALAFARFEEEWPGEGFGEVSDRRLARALGALAGERIGSSLYVGVAGVAWATAQLGPRAGERRLGFLEEQVDPALLEHVRGGSHHRHYDLTHGLTGIGVYALERLDSRHGRDLLAAVVEWLAEAARPLPEGVAWATPPELVPEWLRRRAANGHFGLGLAHGTPGPIALLGAACAHSVAVETARPLLERAVAWLLAHDDDPYAHWTPDGEPPHPTRAGWCYGDPGVAVALLIAARGARRADWEERALAIARRAAPRDREQARVVDVPLCHGAAGLAHMFGRLHAASGDPALQQAAVRWLRTALELRRGEEGIAGFPLIAWDNGRPRPTAAPGLLQGAAGIALALLSADAPGSQRWDRFLLVSAPGLP